MGEKRHWFNRITRLLASKLKSFAKDEGPGLQTPDSAPPKQAVEALNLQDTFALHERCLQEGLCPMCAATGLISELTSVSYRERVCPKCGFRHFNATPERLPHATD